MAEAGNRIGSLTSSGTYSDFGYKELLTVFLAVAISTMAARFAGNYVISKCGWQKAELLLFAFVYVSLRVKWYLDDVKEDSIKLPRLDKNTFCRSSRRG